MDYFVTDRKKDLLKLQFGEYVSLGKVEAELKVCPLVENVCVYGESSSNYIVAIVSPIQKNLEELAQALGKEDLRREKLCFDDDIKNAILKELLATGKKGMLESTIRKIIFSIFIIVFIYFYFIYLFFFYVPL